VKTKTTANAGALPRASCTLLLCAAAALWAMPGTANAALGNYPNTTVQLGGNTTVTPDAAPTNTTSIDVSTSTNFKGRLEGNPGTGVVRVTDAHPAGAYTVTVTGFDSVGVPTTKTFTLTVITPPTCNPVTFAAPSPFAVAIGPASVAVGDFDGDGNQDLATANANNLSNNVSVVLGDGAGGFDPATNFDVSPQGGDPDPRSVAVGDFNGDGIQDLAVANRQSNKVAVLLGNGLGGFFPFTDFDVGGQPFSVVVGDFNGDAKQDLAVVNSANTSHNVAILLGNGAGGFGPATNFDVGIGTPISVAVGDFNDDGNQDLVVANGLSTSTVSVLLGNGLGGFDPFVAYPVGAFPSSVAVGDFNGDGKQDLAVANSDDDNVSVLLGNGLGSFGMANNFNVGNFPRSVAVGDFDGDGKQDLVVANQSSDNVSILLGLGTGSFSAATNFFVGGGSSSQSVEVGDFNGDGKQDFVTANQALNQVAVLLRQCPTGTPPMITSPLFANRVKDQPFTYQFEAEGATTLAVSNLPPGLTFNTSLAAIIGTPTEAGTFQVGLSASNTAGTTTATLTITVPPVPPSGPIIVSSTAATGRTGQPFSFHVITTGGSPSEQLSVSGLPPGLAYDPVSGLISGTPTSDGSFAVTLTVTDGNLTTTSILQLTFTSDLAVPVIISSDRAALTPGEFFSYTISAPSSADPSTDPTIFTLIGTLPSGLGFDAATGTISGIYTGPLLASANGGPRQPELAGGALLGSIQLFATNSHGTSTFPLEFLRASSGAVNISTRLLVGTGDNVLIGGFIIQGNAPEGVIIRAIGPSLSAFGITGALQDPTLELKDANGLTLFSNDNWRDTQEQLIIDAGNLDAGDPPGSLAPTDDRESAIVVGLDPGNYTAIVAGKNGAPGIALVEVYDLGTAAMDAAGSARLANISTRGFVDTGDSVIIGGFIIKQAPATSTRVVIRAIGPSLAVSGALGDPTLELHDGNGALIASNDNWRSDQEAEIIATTIPPTNDLESAIVRDLTVGSYTAIVRGTDNTIGVALVEVYALQ
jgi:FG-GAP-like repeat/Putative Ig domain